MQSVEGTSIELAPPHHDLLTQRSVPRLPGLRQFVLTRRQKDRGIAIGTLELGLVQVEPDVVVELLVEGEKRPEEGRAVVAVRFDVEGVVELFVGDADQRWGTTSLLSHASTRGKRTPGSAPDSPNIHKKNCSLAICVPSQN